MNTEPLHVKRSGDFYYPIYFEEGFDSLADAIRTEGPAKCVLFPTLMLHLYMQIL